MSTKHKKAVEGYWECRYCGTKDIPGFTKNCPNCAHPVGENQKYYIDLKTALQSKALDETKLVGPDWECAACGSYNKATATTCVNCGAPREIGRSYFEETKKKTDVDLTRNIPPRRRNWFLIITGLIAVFLIFTAIINNVTESKEISVTLESKTWRRVLTIEEYKTVEESGWSLPKGAELLRTKEEVRSYDQVFSHYEEVPVQKTRQVYAGEDCEQYTVDNGDGSFDLEEYCTPVYETEYYTEYESRPVYNNVPRYETKYYYQIQRWVEVDKKELSGENNKAQWPEVSLKENQKIGNRIEDYKAVFVTKSLFNSKKTKTYKISSDMYDMINTGTAYKIKTANSRIIEIKE